jgi:flagella basal body P-ring formation protein FlgA
MKIVPLLLLAGSAFAGCVPIHGGRILGRDLALADARFTAVPATETIGFAPAPGNSRILPAAELARIARAHGISIPNPAEVCFEIPMRQVSGEEAVPAMRRSLPAEAALTIVEMAKADVPAGELDFPITGLEPPAPAGNGVQLWRGFVKYADTRKAQVWARVLVTERLNAVVAVKDLPRNVAIEAAALRIELRTGPIQRDHAALRMEDVVGRIPKRLIKAGSPIALDILDEAPAVRRGEPVRVEVRSGLTRLSFEAIADKEANNGDMVELRNPSNGKVFRARLEGSKAVIVIGAGKPL